MGKMKALLGDRPVTPPRAPSPCQARQYSDQMVCAKCDLAWDVNDPEPPKCRND